jgi:hypothetical protein
MALLFQRKPTVEEAALQREYARVLLSLRGYLDVPQQPPQPGDKNISIHPTEVSESDGRNANDLISITPSFVTPPIAAFVDGKYPLKVQVLFGEDERANVSLSVPVGTGRHGGPVTLVWPERRVTLTQPIRIKRKSTVGVVEFDSDEQTPGEFYLTMDFWQEPVEVHIGGQEIPPEHYTWDGDSHLIIHVPKDTPSGPVLVLTQNQVFMSPESFARPGAARKATDKS